MKKLFSISTIAVILLSFLVTSCDKETPVAPPVPAPMTMEATTTWTPNGETKPKVEKGDFEGVRGMAYYIVPKLNVCNCNGTWTYDVEAPKNTAFNKDQNKTTGTVGFITMSYGTYKIIITYTCPNGSSVSKTVTITVK
jgi:hypothetical protein